MKSKDSSQQDAQPKNPKTALALLYAAFAKSGQSQDLFFEDLGWESDRPDQENVLELAEEIKSPTKKSSVFELESAARDIFWNPHEIAEKINSCVLSINTKDLPEEFQKKWDEYFDFKNASVLFDISPEEGDGESLTEVIIGNKANGWMISFSGSMGEYYDENYDLTISTTCYVELNNLEFEKEISKRLAVHFDNAFSNFSDILDNLVKKTPKDIQIDFSKMIMDAFKSKKGVLREAFALHEKNLIKKALGYGEGSIPVASPKSKSSTTKKI